MLETLRNKITVRWLIVTLVLLYGVFGPIWLFNSVGKMNESTESKGAPPEGLSQFELGQYYFNHGIHADGTYDLVKARHHFEESLSEGHRINKLTWYQLGRIDFLEGKFDDAIYKFEAQKRTFGDLVPNVHYMVGLTHGYRARKNNSAEDWRQAEEGFKNFVKIEPESPWARVDLSWVYFSQGKYQEMLEPIEEGLIYTPHNPWLLNMHGLALLNTGSREKAKEEFKKALSGANELTEFDWGMSYPGNDPQIWGEGLAEFRNIIKLNLEQASSYPQS